MSAPLLRLTSTTETRPTLRLSPSDCRQLGIATDRSQDLDLHFGLRSRRVTVIPSDKVKAGTASLCAKTARRLLLPQTDTIGLHTVGPGALRLGPLVALLISYDKLQALRKGHEDNVYRRYNRYAEQLGACMVFFAVTGVDLEADCLEAWELKDDYWYPVLVPLPRVVYDRCFGYKARREAVEMRRLARQRGIVVINNPVKITKLESFEVLRRDPALQPLLPHTEPLTEEALQTCSFDFPAVYLKPDNLSKGQGVFRASRKDDGWLLERSNAIGHQTWTFRHIDDLLAELPLEHPYLVQQAIDLATYQGNPYDLRAAVQKDSKGEWQVAGLVARLAPERGVVTSPRSGGRVLAAPTALAASFGGKWPHVPLSDRLQRLP